MASTKVVLARREARDLELAGAVGPEAREAGHLEVDVALLHRPDVDGGQGDLPVVENAPADGPQLEPQGMWYGGL